MLRKCKHPIASNFCIRESHETEGVGWPTLQLLREVSSEPLRTLLILLGNTGHVTDD